MSEVDIAPSAYSAYNEHARLSGDLRAAQAKYELMVELQPTGWLARHFEFAGRDQKEALVAAALVRDQVKEAYTTQLQDSANHTESFREEAVAFEEDRTDAWSFLSDELARIKGILGTKDDIEPPSLEEFISHWSFYNQNGQELEDDIKDGALRMSLNPVRPRDEVIDGLHSDKILHWESEYVRMLPLGFGGTLADAIHKAEQEDWAHLLKVDRSYWTGSRYRPNSTQDWSTYVALPEDIANGIGELISWDLRNFALLTEESHQDDDFLMDDDICLTTTCSVIDLEQAKAAAEIEYAPFKVELAFNQRKHKEADKIEWRSYDKDALRLEVLSRILAEAGVSNCVIQVNGESIGIEDFILGDETVGPNEEQA
jgi:hypothetical protein